MDVDYIRSVIDYNPETGVFIWKMKMGTAYAGDEAGTVFTGYRHISINRKRYSAHRLAWIIYYGEEPSGYIDHVNRDKLDNRISNLRECDYSENTINQGKRITNKSGYKGVSSDGWVGWRADVWKNRKQYYLGRFDCKIEAAKAYDEKAIELHGEFAATNKSLGLI